MRHRDRRCEASVVRSGGRRPRARRDARAADRAREPEPEMTSAAANPPATGVPSTVAPPKAELIRRLAHEGRPQWRVLLVLVALSLAATPLALLAPVPIKIAIDNILGSEPLPGFVAVLLPAGMESSGTALVVLAASFVVLIALL